MAVAILTGSTVIALVVIGLALVGLLLLARDWLREPKPAEIADNAHRETDEHLTDEDAAQADRSLNPDMFEPDVSYDEAVESAAADEDLDVDDTGDRKT